MRILKASDENAFLSKQDKDAITGEVFNIMCRERIFDTDGAFMGVPNEKSTEKDPNDDDGFVAGDYLSAKSKGKSFSFVPVQGYIIVPAGDKEFVEKCKRAITEHLVNSIPRYEKEYLANTRLAGYLSGPRCVHNDIFANMYVVPNCSLIRDAHQIADRADRNGGAKAGRAANTESKSNTKIQFAHSVDYLLENYACFTWYVISIDEFEFDIYNVNCAHRIADRIASVFYDFMNISVFNHGMRVSEFDIMNLKFHRNFIHEHIGFSPYINPICGELRAKNHNIHNKPKFNDISREVLSSELKDLQIDVPADGKYLCYICEEEVYDDNYVSLSKDQDSGKVICAFCMHTGRDDLRTSPKTIYRVKFPMTIIQKIDSLGSVVSGRKKMILKCATAGCVPLTIKENGITIKYINLSDQYIVVGSKIHTIKFTKFAANLPEGVKMLSAYESDKTLE